jgi:hypothetical protein
MHITDPAAIAGLVAGRVDAFQRNRSRIESLVRRKYLSWPVEKPDYVLVKTLDVERLSNSDPARER